MRFFHPDGHRDDPGRRAIAEAESKEINEAYKTLSDPLRREAYTQSWRLFQSSPQAYALSSELHQQLEQATGTLEQMQAELDRLRRDMARRDQQLRKATESASQQQTDAARWRAQAEALAIQVRALQAALERRKQDEAELPSQERPSVNRTAAAAARPMRQAAAPELPVEPSQPRRARMRWPTAWVQNPWRKWASIGVPVLSVAALLAFVTLIPATQSASRRQIAAEVVLVSTPFLQVASHSTPTRDILSNPFSVSTPLLPSPTPMPTATPIPTATPLPTASPTIIPTPTELPSPLPPTPAIQPSGTVVAESLNVRSGPSSVYPVMATVRKGQSFHIVGKDAQAVKWWRIVLADGRQGWVIAEPALFIAHDAETVPQAQVPPPPTSMSTTPPTPASPPATAIPQQNWVLVGDSIADFANRVQDPQWGYLYSEGRNNFNWKPMRDDRHSCPEAPEANPGYLCADRGLASDYGNIALLWKAPRGGKYMLEWDVRPLKGSGDFLTYKHLERVFSVGRGPTLPNSIILEKIDEWQMFFFVVRAGYGGSYEVRFQVKIYRWQ
jgi:hypothetical protein